MRSLTKLKIFNVTHVCNLELVLVITYLGGRFGINCPSAFLKILKLPELIESNFKIFKNQGGDLSLKSPEPNI